jgi:protein-S-isoprenylcysteine O-methyltransferase Ste14
MSATSLPRNAPTLTHAAPTHFAGRALTLLYGVLAYASFGAAITYAIGFVGNWIVPKSIDSGTPGPIIPSLLINSALLMAFVVQHTVMARPAFKRWITQYIPRSIERSTFVYAAAACFGLLFWQWRPLPQIIWQVETPALAWAISGVSLLGYVIVVLASCMVSHADLFGLRQTWLRFTDKAYTPVGFKLRGLYKLVRHPLMLGFIIAFWATPVMTVGHLFFAIMVSIYIAVGVWFEERDLIAEHGESYLAYRRQVRGIIPLPRSSN